jgi:DNA primase
MTLGRHLRKASTTQNVRDGKRGKKRQEWLSRVDVVDFLERLEVNNIERATADEVKFSCPFSGHAHGDEDPSAYMNTGEKDRSRTTVFKCHGCGRSGNAISFYAEHQDITKQEAATRLREVYASEYRRPEGGIRQEFEQRWTQYQQRRQAPDHELPTIEWERYHDEFGVNWDDAHTIYEEEGDDCPRSVSYLLDRGFSPATLDEWSIGYDDYSERLTIPVCNEDGDLVGIKARTWKEKKKPKYLILGDKPGKRKLYGFEPYEKSLVVFGLDRIPGPDSTAVMCEGELDVIALWQLGIPAICTGSAHLSTIQSQLVRSRCDEVIVWYDEGTAGDNAVYGYESADEEWHPGVIEVLEPHIRVRIVQRNDRDPARLIEDGEADRVREIIEDAVLSYRIR